MRIALLVGSVTISFARHPPGDFFRIGGLGGVAVVVVLTPPGTSCRFAATLASAK
jgi:hypothetical protein